MGMHPTPRDTAAARKFVDLRDDSNEVPLSLALVPIDKIIKIKYYLAQMSGRLG
jgi:hypothetical protein